MKEKTVTLNIYADQGALIDNIINSIVKNNEMFLSQCQIIILDASNEKQNIQICKERREEFGLEIEYLDCCNLNRCQAYNKSRELWKGEYINFSSSSAEFGTDSIQKAYEFVEFKRCKVVALTPSFTKLNGRNEKYITFRDVNKIIYLEDDYSKINFYIDSYFIKRELVEDLYFNEKFLYEGMEEFLVHILQDNKRYALINATIVSEIPLELDFYNYEQQYYKEWYTESIQKFIIPCLEKTESRFTKFAMLYLIHVKFACNINDRHKAILSPQEIEEFFQVVGKALAYIDDDILCMYNVKHFRIIPKSMGFYFMKLKYREYDAITTIEERDKIVGTYKGVVIENENSVKINVKAINYIDSALVIDTDVLNVHWLDYNGIQVVAKMNGEEYIAKQQNIYSLIKFFNHSIHKAYTFQMVIPISQTLDDTTIEFELRYDDIVIPLPLLFCKIQARLFEDFAQGYWKFGNHILSYNKNTAKLVIEKYKFFRAFKHELKLQGSYFKKGKKDPRARKSILLRWLYWITRPFFRKKQIWLTFDQLFKGGDNGEYFYRYVSERKDKKKPKIYYVLNASAPEYPRLKKKYHTVLKFNSVWHKVVSLHATMIFATRVDVKLYCGYWSRLEKYFRDLFNADITCLQHGLTIQRIAQYQNRLFDNTKLYFCVSPYEVKNLEHEVYGYNKEQLILTGAPRYDGLINNDQRYILISPTWRRNVTAGTNKKGSTHEYSINFKHTEYFHIYNKLINDERIIACAKKYNYRIKYLIHPILSPQIVDFDKNEFVDIIAGAGDISYEKMLTEASLMLTDYSGIQFDFANMRKPLVYYHPDTLPPQYEEGGLKYDEMGFGPVCVNHEEVIKQLCDYMETNCQLKQEYRTRIDEFFAFADTNNCERVYNAAMKYISEK